MAMSLVASTRGIALLPAYAKNFLPWSVISRPIQGDSPTIDLVLGYNKANTSPILRLFLSRGDELIARVSNNSHYGLSLAGGTQTYSEMRAFAPRGPAAIRAV